MAEINPPVGEDLSGGSTPAPPVVLKGGAIPPVVPGADRLALEDHNHRLNLQRSTYSSAMAFIVVLYLAAIVFAAWVFAMYRTAEGDWHLTLLAGGFIVTPTVLMLALLRAVYEDKPKSKNESNLPLINLVREIAGACKDVFK